MTKNEAIKLFRELLEVPSEMLIKYDSVTTEEQKKALVNIRLAEEMAIQALKEIQKYRAIGTVEECREAVGRMKPKKPITYKGTNRADCPNCGGTVRGIDKPFGDWCSKCGQKIDWSE